MQEQIFEESGVRVMVTNPREPEEGRVFVYSKARWYERETGPWGDVAFPHVADQEEDLDDFMAQGGEPEELIELDPVDYDFARSVIEEFASQVPLYPEAPERSDEPPFSEREPEIESEHVHFDEEAGGEQRST